MTRPADYREINRQSWNLRVEAHLRSAFYDVPGFLAGKSSLNPIELGLLGDLRGKSLLHLQCHFGQDTISLARLGAEALGVDFSERAIEAAQQLAAESGVQARFLCSDLYALPEQLEAQFDLVFSSYGTIGWLPDLEAWAAVIARFLRPGGRFVFVEFHPVVWMFDNHFETVQYRYFKSEPIVEAESGTYADREADIRPESITWNHSLGEVLGSLLARGLQIEAFEEFDYSPYDCFAGTVEAEPGKFRIAQLGDRIPMLYALAARKPEA